MAFTRAQDSRKASLQVRRDETATPHINEQSGQTVSHRLKAVIGHISAPENVPRRRCNNEIAAEKQMHIIYTLAGKQHTLTIRLQAHALTDEYDSATKYVADFFLDGSKRCSGDLNAFRIDRSKKAWVRELCYSSAEGATAETFRTLYTTTGKPRAFLRQYPLDKTEIMYIDSFELRGPLNGIGLSTAVLEAVHTLFGALQGEFAFRGTVVLSPARPDTAHAARHWSATSEFAIEGVLMGLYGKAGYEVWVQEKEADSVSVMGRTIPQ